VAALESIRPRVVLASIPFFAEVLDGEQIDLLAADLYPKEFAKGSAFIREDELGTSLFVIVEGSVGVTVGEHGKDRVATLSAGDMVGEMSLMTGARRSATVTADTPVVALEITKAALEPILNESPGLVERFAAMLDRRQAELDRLYGAGNWNVFGLGGSELTTVMRGFFAGTI
jgi:CRP-like cAMP-binding protein